MERHTTTSVPTLTVTLTREEADVVCAALRTEHAVCRTPWHSQTLRSIIRRVAWEQVAS
jgi:hypothetical protein